MDARNKEYSKTRFAICLTKILENNKQKSLHNKAHKIEDLALVDSLRKLAASSTVDFATIQRMASGKKNPAWSTVTQVINGLNLDIQSFGEIYDRITDKEIEQFYTDSLLKTKKKSPVKKRKG